MLKLIVGRLFGFSHKITELERKVKELGWDDCFGVHTRAGFHHACNLQPRGVRVLIFLDFDYIHEMNEVYGYEEVNRRIRELFSANLRKCDLAGRHFSGDEIVLLLDVANITSASRIMKKLQTKAATLDLSFTWACRKWIAGDNCQNVIIKLAEEVQKKKQLKRSKEFLERSPSGKSNARTHKRTSVKQPKVMSSLKS